MKFSKALGFFVLGALLFLCSIFAILKYIDVLGYPIIAGGSQISPNGQLTARSLAIVDRSFWGKQHRYYRFELRQGGANNGNYGPVIKEVTMEPISGEEFLMPRGGPAFLINWNNDDTVAIFSGQGITLTLGNKP